jgi:hypothetical protein
LNVDKTTGNNTENTENTTGNTTENNSLQSIEIEALEYCQLQ